MKNKSLIIISAILIAMSISAFLYPTLSEAINNYFAKNTVDNYNTQVQSMDSREKEHLLSLAKSYNQNISNIVSDSFSDDSFNADSDYSAILSVTGDGQIGSVHIPSINCTLPIYHGNVKENLDKGAVHMPNTSFPIGGKSTHAVISAHTAFPGKELFNRLTELTIGDYFTITVLGDTLKYRVTDINVVLPSDTSLLEIVNGKDLCTLVTCTPYSINTHRLLVRGERVFEVTSKPSEQTEKTETVIDNTPNRRLIIVPAVLSAIVMILIIRKKKRGEGKTDEE